MISLIVLTKEGDGYNCLTTMTDYARLAIVKDIVIWNCYDEYICPADSEKIIVVNSRCSTIKAAFLAACLGQSDCVVFLDSEVLIAGGVLLEMHRRYLINKNGFFTLKGFNRKENTDELEILSNVQEPTPCDIASLNLACVSKRYAAILLNQYDYAIKNLETDTSSKEALFSYVYRNAAGRKPLVVPWPAKERESGKWTVAKRNHIKPSADNLARFNLLYPQSKLFNARSAFSTAGHIAIFADSITFNCPHKHLLVKQNHGISYFSFSSLEKTFHCMLQCDWNLNGFTSQSFSITYFFLEAFPVSSVIHIDYTQGGEEKTLEIPFDFDTDKLGVPCEFNFSLKDALPSNFKLFNIKTIRFEFIQTDVFEFCFAGFGLIDNDQAE